MHRTKLVLTLITLLIATFLSAAAFAEESPAASYATIATQTDGTPTVLQRLGIELEWLTAPQRPMMPQTNVVLDCAHFDSSWCTYKLDKINVCCYPIWTAPGANCPLICA